MTQLMADSEVDESCPNPLFSVEDDGAVPEKDDAATYTGVPVLWDDFITALLSKSS